MGGPGSGRHASSTKTTVSDCRAIDIHVLNDEGCLTAGSGGKVTWSKSGDDVADIGWHVTSSDGRPQLDLRYAVTAGDDDRRVTYSVPIVYTEPHFGGKRPWFQCPGPRHSPCGERVGKLYKPPHGSDRFLCRHCHDLAYESNTRQGGTVYEALSKPYDRIDEAKDQLREDGLTRENLRELYEAKKEFREGMGTVTNLSMNALFGPTPIDVEPLPPFEEWLDDVERRIYNELYGRDHGEYGQCEATAQTTDRRCRQPATGDHGKCHYHGGAAGSGAPEGNQNAAGSGSD